ncbi:MAG: twin-arginine translocase subunit TatC [Verrucomicrobia bacterium]|nr:twin-arginine translocase subunit TatC [Verrucomicrobiota bacterium]
MKNLFKKVSPRFVSRDKEQSFLEHLEEFRTMLIRCLMAVAIATVVCIPLAKPLLNWLKAPLLRVAEQNHYTLELITTSPVEGFVQVMKIIFCTGILLSLPFIIYFVACFVFPGLKAKEQKLLVYGGLAGAVLFAGGVTLCYSVTLPIAIKIMFYFNNYLGTTANWKIDTYLSFVMQLLIGFGLIFELPLILLLLGHLGVISTAQMRKYRRHVIIAILIIAMALTPGPDVISQLQMAIPLYILYEVCILILLIRNRKSGKEKEGSGK